ncbi:MAG: CinA family protein [Saccharospirillaceae bacterium]|nr:CinA family protein [Pseudomonadales bacterium]NRB78056.1 CinA family protein [Saccharospirillaceae bacterium]
MNTDIADLVLQLNDCCQLQKKTVSTAESCTGGLVSANITEQNGVSSWFLGGIVSYANECKQNILKVNSGDLEKFGAVSETVALQMAIGANQITGSDYAVSLTGVAGPGGGTKNHPVGTVWIAWANKNEANAECFLFNGDRKSVRELAVKQALLGLIKKIKK